MSREYSETWLSLDSVVAYTLTVQTMTYQTWIWLIYKRPISWIGLDWAGFNVSTNTVYVIRETVLQVKRPNQQHQSTEGKVGQPQTGRGSKPTRGLPPCYKWTSEKRKTLSQWVKPRETKPHTAGRPVQVLYRSCNNRCCYATTDATEHLSVNKRMNEWINESINEDTAFI